jgi:Lrp/AsnC family transcriptional regulator
MKQIPSLDPLDRKLLHALQTDAMLSHVELADRIGSSPASVWRRIKALEASGLLKRAVRLLDPALLGCGVNVLCNIRIRNHTRDLRSGFEAFVQRRPEILECFSMSGDWDYLLHVVAQDVKDYERFLMDVLLEHPAVGGASSHFALSVTKYTTALPIEGIDDMRA